MAFPARIFRKTIREVVKCANFDKERFAEEIQSHIEDRQTVDFTEQAQYENDRKSAARFLKLVGGYSNAEEMTTLMLNEFVEKIIVHERDRKGSADTTQKIEIYFNFIGEYIPPTMAEKEPTPEELEEMRKKEARKDRLHQNYLKRKANGKQ